MPDDFSDSDDGDIPKPHHQQKQKLGTYDVLCGRCSTAFNNIGNHRFRATISVNLKRYINAETRSEKSAVIVSIVDFLMKEQGARFFKLKNNSFVELDIKTIRQKVGHALRDAAQKFFGSSQSSLASFRNHSTSVRHETREGERSTKVEVPENINTLVDSWIADDLSVEESISVSSHEIFPDIVTPETPEKCTLNEMFGKMVYEIDNLTTIQDIDTDNDEDLMGILPQRYVAEKATFYNQEISF